MCCLSEGRLNEYLCLFDIGLHLESFVGLVILVCRYLEVNDSRDRSYIIVIILKFSHAGNGNLCAITKSGEIEKYADESVSDVYADAAGAGVISLIIATRYR